MAKNTPPYEVGYGRPPKHTRFKPGQSGNPQGRPKDQTSFEKKLEKAFLEETMMTINGRRRRMSLEDASIQKLKRDILQSNPKDRIAILKFFLSFRSTVGEEEVFNCAALTEEELDTLERILMKAAGEEPPAGPSPGPE